MSSLRQRHTDDTNIILDEDEQNAVIDDLGNQLSRSLWQTKLRIAPLGLLLFGTYLFFAAQAMNSPWSVRHHAELRDVLRPMALVAGDLGSGLAIAGGTAAVVAFCNGSPPLARSILGPSVILTSLVATFWSLGIVKMLRLREYDLDGSWRVFWLPTAPTVWALISVSIINTLAGLEKDLRTLRAARYRFRRV